MNFLAHIYLSGDNNALQIGNFIGDFVKGKELENFSEDIRKGIILHRHIDEFTDSHPVVLNSKKKLRPKYRHYAAVIVDVYYDHFLAALWENYHNKKLLDYTIEFYKLTESYEDIMPVKARHMLKYMKRDNWLYNYRLIEGIKRTLTGMASRTKFESGMEFATIELDTFYTSFKEDFELFFPELEKHCEDLINSAND